MSSQKDLSAVMTAMLRSWHQKDLKECYRLYFTLDLEDRQLLREAFRVARKKAPVPQMKKASVGIYKLLEQNIKREVSLMVDNSLDLLFYWFNGGEEVFFSYYSALGSMEKELFVQGLVDGAGKDENHKIRQAAIDIPIYLASKAEASTI